MRELEYPFDSQYILQKHKKLKKELINNKKNDKKKRIAILSGATVGIFQDILELFLLNHQIYPEFYQGDYYRYYEEGSFGTENLDKFQPEIVYFHISLKNLLPLIEKGLEEKDYEMPNAEDLLSPIKQAILGVQKRYHCMVIVNNFELPPFRVMGNAECYHKDSEIYLIQEANRLLVIFAEQTGNVYMNDLNYQSAYYGLERWFDHNLWYLYKYPYAMDAIPYVAFNVSNIIKSIYGKNKKVIVLDLDQTLWGGIIGEDGIENISLGIENAKGMYYHEFQKYLKKLMRKGVALTICSKNEEETAKKGFLHSESVLKIEDFVSFQANWKEKSYNIQQIAKELNVLLESMVFIDDSINEREQVLFALPEVAVLPLEQKENYIQILDGSGYFEITTVTQDDLKRNEYYKQNKLQQEERKNYKSYEEYLSSLQMKAQISFISEKNIKRAVQLINKTNQFNMTTRRFTEIELTDYLKLEGNYGLAICLKDRFGDNGIVSIVLYSLKNDYFVIENWLMSCRVFQRDLEIAIFEEMIYFCNAHHISKIIGFFQRTEKNKVVCQFYQSLGFMLEDSKNGQEIWKLEVDHYKKRKTYITEEKQKFWE